MKNLTFMAAGLLLVSTAFGQTGTTKEIRKDKKEIREEKSERNEDLEHGKGKAAVKEQREINRDRKDLKNDKEVRKDRKEVREDKRERNEDLREGKGKAAVREQKNINRERRDIRRDVKKAPAGK